MTAPLSPREREIAQLRARGLSIARIADAAYIQPQTVRNHLTRIYCKLEIVEASPDARLRRMAQWWYGNEEYS